MVSCIVARVGAHSDIIEFANASKVPVINALSDDFHPLQAITDILTITENLELQKGCKLAWVGDANNVLHDLAMACCKLGIQVSIATPNAYPLRKDMLGLLSKVSAETKIKLEIGHDAQAAVKNADIIVTDTW